MKNSELRIREIALDDIDRSRNHRIPRFGDAQRFEALKKSIQASGQLLQPVRLYERGPDQQDKKHKEPYILGFGDRRCRAVLALGHKTVPSIILPPATDAEIAQARAVENLHRQDITPLEEVLAVADVLEAITANADFMGDPHEEAAIRLGCEITWVKDRDYLHRLTKPVQNFALRSGLPAGHLRELAKVGDPAEQMRLACEMAGAPAHAFPAEKEKKLEEWQKQMQENYFAELADGKAHRWTLSHLKEQVAKVRLSLRQIPWAFDQPVQFGEIKLPKCAGCTHNSESDRTLFGIDEDAVNPNGFCLNPACYESKHKAVEGAKEQVLKKIRQKEDQTPEAIRQLAPAWLKETTVVGFVQRQLAKGAEDKSEPKTRSASRGRTLTDHEQALVAFAEAHRAWEEKAFRAVLKGINSDPVHRVSWCVLLGVAPFWAQASVGIPSVQIYSQEPTTKDPVLPPLSDEIEQAIKLAFKGKSSAWTELLAKYPQGSPHERRGTGILHPKALELLAEAMKIKVPTMPQWKPTTVPAPEVTASKPEVLAA